MSERYLISGCQLGLLQKTEEHITRQQLVNEIIKNQFVGNSELSVKEDAKNVVLKKPFPHIEFGSEEGSGGNEQETDNE